jgi:hypothetical protein
VFPHPVPTRFFFQALSTPSFLTARTANLHHVLNAAVRIQFTVDEFQFGGGAAN